MCLLAGYTQQLVQDAVDQQLPAGKLYLGQYVKVQLVRLVVDVDGSCKYSKLHW